MEVLPKLETDLPQYLTVLFLGKSYYRGTLSSMFIAAPFIIAIHWKSLKHQSAGILFSC